MGDWCATAQPLFENQVRGKVFDGSAAQQGKMRGRPQ
jgi:hypothetical protein